MLREKPYSYPDYHKLILWSWLGLWYHLLFFVVFFGGVVVVLGYFFFHSHDYYSKSGPHSQAPGHSRALAFSSSPHLDQDTRGQQPQSMLF